MAYQLDPYSMVYNGIRDTLEATPAFTELVPEANRIYLTGIKARRPEKDSRTESGIPETQLRANGLELFENRSCNGADVIATYRLNVATGDRRLGDIADTSDPNKQMGFLYPISWALTQVTWKLDSVLFALEYDPNGTLPDAAKKFVKDYNVATVEEALDFTDINQQIVGWSAVWDVVVRMSFPDVTLRGE